MCYHLYLESKVWHEWNGNKTRGRQNTGGYQGGEGWEREEVGAWDLQMQTGIYRMDKQQGPTV